VIPVVVVHRNRPERLAATVAAFQHQRGVDVAVTVVDNGSPAVPDVRGAEVVALGANLGFGPAANAGFRRWLDDDRPWEYVALAPDDAVPEPACLAQIVESMDGHPRAGLACADLGDGATPVLDPYFGGILAPARVAVGWEPAGHPHGTLLVARRACLDDVGLFDERYFAYCEEADLALRAAAAGWECGLVRGARVRNTHLGSTTAVVDYLQLRNTLLLVREHSGRYHASIRFAIALVQLASGLAMPSRRGPYWHPRGRVRALRDYAAGRYGPPPAALVSR
jgi:GT2 family glycosyltransferase